MHITRVDKAVSTMRRDLFVGSCLFFCVYIAKRQLRHRHCKIKCNHSSTTISFLGRMQYYPFCSPILQWLFDRTVFLMQARLFILCFLIWYESNPSQRAAHHHHSVFLASINPKLSQGPSDPNIINYFLKRTANTFKGRALKKLYAQHPQVWDHDQTIKQQRKIPSLTLNITEV